MQQRIPSLDWDSLRLFLAVWRSRSLSGAARALGVDQSTASRRLAALESELGVRLFDRVPSGLEPTATAVAVAPMADSAEARVLEFTRCAAGADLALHGVVRVAVPEGIDSELLVPELGRLQARFPGVVLELAASNAVVNLARHEADLALRFVRPKGGDLVARRVGTLRSGVFGLHAHVQRGVGRAHWVVCTEAFRSPPEARWYDRNVPEGNVRLRCNRLEALMAAARSGVGLAVLPEALAARDASLERCTDGEAPPEAPLWLVGHRELLRVPRVRAVWKFLIETVGRLLE